MESARLKPEQTKSEPAADRSQKSLTPVTARSGSALILSDAHPPAMRLGQAFGPAHAFMPAIQTKLTINEPGDQYEQEADRVADQVMRMPKSTLHVQRKCGCGGATSMGEPCAECASHTPQLQRRASAENSSAPALAPSVVHDVLRSSGQPLDQATRSFMEPRFGQDFSQVRVHTDARASQSARAVNALAYTVGRDVVFRSDQYASATESGRRLLAHELTHVVQQGGARHKPGPETPTLQRYPDGAGLLGDFTLRPPELPSLRPGSIREAFVIAPPDPALDTTLQLPSSLGGTPAAPRFNILNERLQAPQLFPIIIPVPACVPDRPLTWADFQGAVPATGTAAAQTSFHHEIFDVQGNPMVRAIFDAGSSWVKPPSDNPTDRALSGGDTLIADCEQTLRGGQGGSWNLTPPTPITCAASPVVNSSIVAHSVGDCTSLIGQEWDRVQVAESARLLRHEQLHFDIACVIARKANLALRRLPANQAPRIRLAAENAANTQTTNYDNQTAHGCIAGAQARWERAVAAGLPLVRIS